MNIFDDQTATRLHAELRRRQHRIVFAESCTAGLVAATLGRIPGISEWLVGSAVVYQAETKSRWLSVSQDSLDDPGPVSRIVSEQMATGVLNKTPHATVAASVTGHLGPAAPRDQDGVAWSSVAIRAATDIVVKSRLLRLDDGLTEFRESSRSETDVRHARQISAVRLVLQFCVECLSPVSL